LLGISPYSLAVGAAYVDAGVTVIDNVDGDISGNIQAVSNVNAAVVGIYTVTYAASDAAGNAATLTRTVNVTDQTAPVISMLGFSNTSVAQGLNYVDAGATAIDNVDGDISGNILVASNVNTSVLGNYSVTYDVSDAAGNASVTRTRLVETVPLFGTKQLGAPSIMALATSVATDTYGNVYVTGFSNGALMRGVRASFDSFFLAKYSSAGVLQFFNQQDVPGATSRAFHVATDSSGNVYVAGETTSGLDGNTQVGTNDLFVTKYDAAGVKQFTKQLGVAGGSTSGRSVATDSSGNVYVTGSTTGGLDGNALVGASDLFLTKYDAAGVKQFTRQLGVPASGASGRSVATDSSGNVYVTGSTGGGLDGNTLVGTADFFVTKYDTAGVKQFTKQLGVTASSTFSNSVTTDSSGNVYVTGSTTGGLDGNALVGTQDIFLTKYDAAGVRQFTKQLGVTALSTYSSSVATDSSGNVYVTGSTTGGLDGNALVGTNDLFLSKYNSAGTKQFTRQMGVAVSMTLGTSVATDTFGNVFVAGQAFGGLDGNVKIGAADFIVTKFSSTGVKY